MALFKASNACKHSLLTPFCDARVDYAPLCVKQILIDSLICKYIETHNFLGRYVVVVCRIPGTMSYHRYLYLYSNPAIGGIPTYVGGGGGGGGGVALLV